MNKGRHTISKIECLNGTKNVFSRYMRAMKEEMHQCLTQRKVCSFGMKYGEKCGIQQKGRMAGGRGERFVQYKAAIKYQDNTPNVDKTA